MGRVQVYCESFNRCYPEKRIEVKAKFRKGGKFEGWEVVIDGEGTTRLLSDDDLISATRDFLRGKIPA